MKKLRLYADTSVFGGCFDDEFSEASLKVFKEIADDRFILVISSLVAEELDEAPERVQALLDRIPEKCIEYKEVTEEMEILRDAYLESGILSKKDDTDALHVAIATVLNVDIIISWNFKHIVNFQKIRAFNAVNILNGYKSVQIYSPKEVVEP